MFPVWLKEAVDTLQDFDGFISVRQLIPIDSPDECHLLLEFENIELLRSWASSRAHDDLIEKLAPYRERKQRSTIFRCGPKLTAR